MAQRLIRGLLIVALALGVLFGGRALGVAEPILVGAVIVFALLTRGFVRR